MTLTFMVGAGRCGSTLLSRMIRSHPEVLGVSELFSALRNRPFRTGEPDGERFWSLLADPDPLSDALVAAGVRPPEWIYPYDSGRFTAGEGIPAIAHMTLPMLTSSPDRLHDELAEEVTTWPARPIADQYRELFGWLAARFGGHSVVERSGASLALVPYLQKTFPDARFVYISRFGPDSAFSMSKHIGFRLMLLGREVARVAGVSGLDEIRPEHGRLLSRHLRGTLTPPFEPAGVMSRPIALSAFGAMWSEMTLQGVEALSQVPSERWTVLGYEDLVRDPCGELERLATFLEVEADPRWLERATLEQTLSRPAASAGLDPRQLAVLGRACAPGVEADRRLRSRQG